MKTVIKELTATNKRLSIDLKKQLLKNEKLDKQIAELLQKKQYLNTRLAATESQIEQLKKIDHENYYKNFKEESALRDQISSLKFQLRATFAEKNVLLRKLNLPAQELYYGTNNDKDE